MPPSSPRRTTWRPSRSAATSGGPPRRTPPRASSASPPRLTSGAASMSRSATPRRCRRQRPSTRPSSTQSTVSRRNCNNSPGPPRSRDRHSGDLVQKHMPHNGLWLRSCVAGACEVRGNRAGFFFVPSPQQLPWRFPGDSTLIPACHFRSSTLTITFEALHHECHDPAQPSDIEIKPPGNSSAHARNHLFIAASVEVWHFQRSLDFPFKI